MSKTVFSPWPLRSANALLVLCGLVAWAGKVVAQSIPWHLGADDGQPPAPSAINTVKEKPGPHRVVVAVIDSGVLTGHPSLAGQLLPGYDMVSGPQNMRHQRSPDVSPDDRDARCNARLMAQSFRTHGTEVASLIAGNGVDGVLGVNPSAKILPIRAFGVCPMSRKDLIDAMAWAAGFPVEGLPANLHPAQIINLSLAGGYEVCGPDLKALVDRLVQNHKFIVAAAGNNFHKPLREPANCPGVMAVGALSAENQIEVYSALDPRTFVYAPGGGALLPVNAAWSVNKLKVATYELNLLGKENPTSRSSGVGTSYAAPLVSGFISLWLSHHPEKNLTDLLLEKAKFLRQVVPLPECAECVPMGLANVGGLATP